RRRPDRDFSGGSLDKRPNPRALPPAVPTARYLGIPTDAEFVIAVMKGVVMAIMTEAIEPLGPVAHKHFTTPSKVRRPISQRRKDALPRSKTNSIENAA